MCKMLKIIFNNRIFQHSLLKVLCFPCIFKPQYYIPWEISHLFAIFIRQVSWTSFLSQSAAWEKSGKWCISPSLHVRSWFRWTPRCSRRGWWSRSGRRPWCKSRWPAMLSQTLGRWWECWSRISHSNHHQCQKAEKKPPEHVWKLSLPESSFPFVYFNQYFLKFIPLQNGKYEKLWLKS